MDNPLRYIDPDGMGPFDNLNPFAGLQTMWNEATLAVSNFVKEVIKYTDVNDAAVLVTAVTRDGDAVNYDGTPANGWDIAGASLGVVVPFAGGKVLGDALQKGANKAADILKINKTNSKLGEDFLKNTYGGEQNVSKSTTDGRRVIDNLTEEGTSQESKVGRTSKTDFVKSQVEKDVNILSDPTSGVKKQEWHFFESPATGKKGPTGPLQKLLDSQGFTTIIH